MSVPAWSLWFLLSALAAVAVVWHYRRREPPGRGRSALAALRASAIAVLLLLLFDPELPAGGGAESPGTAVLLDASLSMTAPGSDPNRTRWEEAVAVARARAGGGPVILFGDRPRVVSPAELAAVEPADARSLVVPALQAAAEAGVRRVVIVSDGGLEDASAAARWAPRLGLNVVPETVGRPLRNRSLVDVSVPAWAEAGQPLRIEFAVAGLGTDSIGVDASSGGRGMGRTVVGGAGAGRLAAGALELRLPASPDGGWTPIEL
ncbi:MAG TPA: VWA domain-containing protein, partial [Longimicrobiales bacterium]|nr:VWA domain-containing protein [Longimicrobiales bacterium]